MTYNNVFNYILMLIDLLFSLHIQGGTLKLASGVLLLAWLHPEAQWEWLFSMESKWNLCVCIMLFCLAAYEKN